MLKIFQTKKTNFIKVQKLKKLRLQLVHHQKLSYINFSTVDILTRKLTFIIVAQKSNAYLIIAVKVSF